MAVFGEEVDLKITNYIHLAISFLTKIVFRIAFFFAAVDHSKWLVLENTSSILKNVAITLIKLLSANFFMF